MLNLKSSFYVRANAFRYNSPENAGFFKSLLKNHLHNSVLLFQWRVCLQLHQKKNPFSCIGPFIFQATLSLLLKDQTVEITSTVTYHLFFLAFSIFTPCGPQKNGIRRLDFPSPLFWLKEPNKTRGIQMSLYFGPRLANAEGHLTA